MGTRQYTRNMDGCAKICVNLVILSLLLFYVRCQHHDHGHSHDAPHMKYTRQANEEHSKRAHSHDHHGHAHDHHGHSHDEVHGHDAGIHSHDHSEDTHGHSHDHADGSVKADVKSSGYMLWVQALGSTFIVSCAPVFILLLIPIDKTKSGELSNQPLLNILLSFASGGLLGDAFLHLIPHALSPHNHDDHAHSHSHNAHSHDHSHDMNVGLWVLTGIVAFLIVEKIVRNIKEGSPHSHTHSHKIEKDETK